MRERIYLGLGSNLGDSKKTLLKACDLIAAIPYVFHLKRSAIYQTPPLSDIPQPDFLNMTVSFESSMLPKSLFNNLCWIENFLGKIPKAKNQPRNIDIDLLYFGNLSIKSNKLTIPHPQIPKRLFVLIPILDLTKSLPNIPDVQKHINKFSINDQQQVKKIYENNFRSRL